MQDTGERLIEKGNEQTLTYGEHLARYNSVVDIVAGKTVLDIASGSGYGTKIIAQSAKKVIGIDYSEQAIKYAKTHYKGSNISYKVGDAHSLPLEDNSVDVVVSFETIEHLKDPEKFTREVIRVLKKNGLFVVSTPNDDEFMEGNEFHIHEFDLKELQKLIKRNFKNYEFYYQGTWFSAGLLKSQSFKTPVPPTKIKVTKSFGQQLNKAIFFIAVASNGPIQELHENIVIADSWSDKENIEREEARRTKEQSLKAMEKALQEKCQRLERELVYIKNTRWWKMRHTVGKARSVTGTKKGKKAI